MGGIMATTGSNIFVGNQTISGSVIPAVNGAYDLGSSTHEFRHLYLSSASLYIDGTKVLGSTTQELQITTDAGQSFKILEAGSDTITLQAADGNITLATSGGGDVILDPTTGIIALKGTTTVYAGNRILSSDGNAIQFGNSVTMTGSLVVTGYIETQELRTTYISSSILYRSGSTKFGDELTDTHSFTGSLSVSGSISVPGSGLVSGSSQITYSGLSGVPSGIISGSSQLPSGLVSGSSQISFGSVSGVPSGLVSGSSQVLSGTGIWSGSAQLPSGVVSGSAQVDVMSTTNIARLATTGSNVFTSNQVVSGSFVTTGNLTVNTGLNTGNAIYANGPTSGNDAVIKIDRGSGSHKGSAIYVGSANYSDANKQGFIELNAGAYSGTQTRYLYAYDNSGDDFIMYGNGNMYVGGNLGLGTTSWGAKLEVADGGIRITETGVSSFTTTYATGRVQFGMDSAGTDGFYFRTYSSGYADRFSIRSNGRVMIGSGSPNGVLDVRGSHVGGYGIVNIVSTDSSVLSLDSTGTQDVRFRIKYNGADKWFTGVYLSDNYDIRSADNTLKISVPQSGSITFGTTLLPTSDATYNLGSTSYRWNNVYTTDLHLSNQGSQNSVDGTWGDWTLQEGENDIFMLNNRSGEKFKIILEKIV